MNWWCSSSPRNWTWTWSPYLGAWAIVGTVVGVAIWWRVRGRHQEATPDPREAAALERGSGPAPGTDRGRALAFVVGVIGLWACLDWPLAALGAGYLASAQMARQILMVWVVAPALLFACPAPLAVRLVGWGRGLAVWRTLARPIVAVPIAAFSLVAVNSPAIVDPLIATPYGSFVMDLVWITAGFVLWTPVQCPHPGVKRLIGPPALVYLVAQSIIPVIPGFFMTWADFPIYSTYELAPRAIEGFDAKTDQQTAAAILQVGSMILLWVQITYRFLRWAIDQTEQDRQSRKPINRVTTGAS